MVLVEVVAMVVEVVVVAVDDAWGLAHGRRLLLLRILRNVLPRYKRKGSF